MASSNTKTKTITSTNTNATGKPPQSSAVKAYLLLYNLTCLVSWSWVLFLCVHHFILSAPTATISPTPLQIQLQTFYPHVSSALYFAQSLALLEILHSLTGLVRAGLLSTLLQVVSRLFLVWGIVYQVPVARTTPSFTTMVLAWALVEVPRYLFYCLNLMQDSSIPYALTWLRYSLFIVLYPMGISSELLTSYYSLPYIAEHKVLSISMPNRLNLPFDYYWFVCLALLVYVPGAPFLYRHMLVQRKKILSGGSAEEKQKPKAE